MFFYLKVHLYRCINGSTLLHTACYYGHMPAILELLAQRVDVNLRDYKGATPLHRAKDKVIMEVSISLIVHIHVSFIFALYIMKTCPCNIQRFLKL